MIQHDSLFFNKVWGMDPYGENQILFTTTYCALLRVRLMPAEWAAFKRKHKMDAVKLIMITLQDKNDYVSHDNMTAIVCLSKMFDLNYHEIYFHRHWWRRIHPRDVGFYIYAKLKESNPFRKLFLLPTFLSELYATFHKQQTMGNLDTDGKLLALLRTLTFRRRTELHILTKLLEKRHNLKWSEVAKIYYRNEKHPNVRHLKAIEKRF